MTSRDHAVEPLHTCRKWKGLKSNIDTTISISQSMNIARYYQWAIWNTSNVQYYQILKARTSIGESCSLFTAGILPIQIIFRCGKIQQVLCRPIDCSFDNRFLTMSLGKFNQVGDIWINSLDAVADGKTLFNMHESLCRVTSDAISEVCVIQFCLHQLPLSQLFVFISIKNVFCIRIFRSLLTRIKS